MLVDDSIVRGTTIANLIHLLKHAGAKEVHVRVSSPPFLYPCYFGTDVPSNQLLIASSHSTEEIRQLIGADSLGYMKIEDLQSMVGDLHCAGPALTITIRWIFQISNRGRSITSPITYITFFLRKAHTSLQRYAPFPVGLY